MKKKLFIGIGSIIAVIMIAAGTSYLLSLHKISFTLQNGVTGATIYRSNKQEVLRISSNGNILLKNGDYYLIPEGPNLSRDPIIFKVADKDMAVSVNPPYSKEYLNGLLDKEKPAVIAAITGKYPSVFTNYTLTRGALYRKGEWFGGLLKPNISDRREQKDPYRIVLQKKDGRWEVIRRPEYVLTSSKYKEVPVDILRTVNLTVE